VSKFTQKFLELIVDNAWKLGALPSRFTFQIDLAELGDYVEHFDAKTLISEPVKASLQ
jgi:hypothetical protein